MTRKQIESMPYGSGIQGDESHIWMSRFMRFYLRNRETECRWLHDAIESAYTKIMFQDVWYLARRWWNDEQYIASQPKPEPTPVEVAPVPAVKPKKAPKPKVIEQYNGYYWNKLLGSYWAAKDIEAVRSIEAAKDRADFGPCMDLDTIKRYIDEYGHLAA